MSKIGDIIGILSPAEIDACADTADARAGAEIRPIVHAVAAATGIPAAEIYSRGRTEHVARARQIVMTAAFDRGMTMQAIGRALGRDHATVAYGIAAERARRAGG